MKKISLNLLCIILVAFFTAGFLQAYASNKKSVSIVHNKELDYTEKLIALRDRYASTLDESALPCAPNYDRNCILTAALDQLETSSAKPSEARSSLIKIAESISYSDDVILKRRALNNINILKSDFSGEEISRQIAIMKLYYSLGEHDKAMKVIQKFQNFKGPVPYNNGPYIAAIDYFIHRDDLSSASQVVLATMNHKTILDYPPSGCFGRGSKSSKIAMLIRQNIDKGDFTTAVALLPAVLNDKSIYYDDYAFGDVIGQINYPYSNSRDVESFPEQGCQYILDHAPEITPKGQRSYNQYVSLATSMDRWGCSKQHKLVLDIIRDKKHGIDWRPTSEQAYTKMQVMLGEGKEALGRIASLYDPKDQFNQYVEIAFFMHFHEFYDLSNSAFDSAIFLFEQNMAHATDEWNPGPLLSYLTHAGRGVDVTSVLTKLVEYKGSKVAVLKDIPLTSYLEQYEHPYYRVLKNDIEVRKSDQYQALLASIKNEIGLGNYKKAEELFDSIELRNESHASQQLMRTLYKYDYRGPLFTKIWHNNIKSCVYSEMYWQKTEDTSLVIPACMAKTVMVSQNFPFMYFD